MADGAEGGSQTVLTEGGAAAGAANPAPTVVDPAKPAEPAKAADPAGGAAKEPGKEPQGAPETYADFTFPEGVEADKAALDLATPVFRELGLTQEKAQQLVDLQTKIEKARADASATEFAALQKTWTDAARADKDFGGATFDANMALARKALEAYGSPELSAALNASGWGNHPELIRVFWKIGKDLADEKFVPGKAATAPKSIADRMFTNQGR